MKRKPAAQPEPPVQDDAVAPEILAPEISLDTRRALSPLRPLKVAAPKCTVCGSDCVPGASEQLCWVCRRLKISAWRDSDQQPAIQE